MYDSSDPRSTLAPSSLPRPAHNRFPVAEFIKFYESDPQLRGEEGRTWIARGQNFVVAYSEAKPGVTFRRSEQPDEYIVLAPDSGCSLHVSAGPQSKFIAGNSLTTMPPGTSEVTVTDGGRIIRIFTSASRDLAASAANADSYAQPKPSVAALVPWPAPPDGFQIRSYSLEVPPQEGRFGRIFRCTTLMVNVLEPRHGPRDVRKVSPHYHEDFEQGSLVVDGAYTHHLRWPWTTDMTQWREDQHVTCNGPSLTVIPPPVLHTSCAIGQELNRMVDIFCPPRADFSRKPGWVLNEDDYPAG